MSIFKKWTLGVRDFKVLVSQVSIGQIQPASHSDFPGSEPLGAAGFYEWEREWILPFPWTQSEPLTPHKSDQEGLGRSMGYGLSFSALSFVRKGQTQTMGSLPGGERAVKDVTRSEYVHVGCSFCVGG